MADFQRKNFDAGAYSIAINRDRVPKKIPRYTGNENEK